MTEQKQKKAKIVKAGAPGSALEQMQILVCRQWDTRHFLSRNAREFAIWKAAAAEVGACIPFSYGVYLPEPPREPIRLSLFGW